MADTVAEVMAEIERGVSRAIGMLSTNVTAELIERTPVDTGWARANWVPAIGGRPRFPTDPGTREGRQSGALGAASRQQTATAALLTYTLSRGKVFISNGVPYLIFLNEGSSAQAPSGFVQDAIEAGIRSLDGLRLA